MAALTFATVLGTPRRIPWAMFQLARRCFYAGFAQRAALTTLTLFVWVPAFPETTRRPAPRASAFPLVERLTAAIGF